MADTTDIDNLPDTPQEVFKLLPAKARLAVFSAAALAGLTLTAITTGIAAVHAPSPQWLTIALAVFPVITSGLGILAGSNIQKPTTSTSTAATVPATTVPDASVTATALLADEPATSTEASPTDTADVSTTAPSTASTPAATFTAAPLPETTTTASETTPTA
jgi:hypothetical protein